MYGCCTGVGGARHGPIAGSREYRKWKTPGSAGKGPLCIYGLFRISARLQESTIPQLQSSCWISGAAWKCCGLYTRGLETRCDGTEEASRKVVCGNVGSTPATAIYVARLLRDGVAIGPNTTAQILRPGQPKPLPYEDACAARLTVAATLSLSDRAVRRGEMTRGCDHHGLALLAWEPAGFGQ